jgi:hypothetical protein
VPSSGKKLECVYAGRFGDTCPCQLHSDSLREFVGMCAKQRVELVVMPSSHAFSATGRVRKSASVPNKATSELAFLAHGLARVCPTWPTVKLESRTHPASASKAGVRVRV